MESDSLGVDTVKEVMQIGIIGYGKMGQEVEVLAKELGHEVVARVNSRSGTIDLGSANVWIDFSTATAVATHCQLAAEMGIPLVIGTTGWENQLSAVHHIISNRTGMIHAPNFAIGVYLFTKIAEQAAQLMEAYDEYDAAGMEMHHKQKIDSPSGTAKHLEKLLGLTFTSIRCGSITGKHSVVFDSEYDTITIEHQAKNRKSFAKGALLAAKWILGKKGVYTLEDMLCES